MKKEFKRDVGMKLVKGNKDKYDKIEIRIRNMNVEDK